LPLPASAGALCADLPRVAQRLVPEEPRVSGVVRLRAREERRVGRAGPRIAVAVNCCTSADARVQLIRVFAARGRGYRKVERGLDRAAGGGGQVPGVEAEVRAEACVGLGMWGGSCG